MDNQQQPTEQYQGQFIDTPKETAGKGKMPLILLAVILLLGAVSVGYIKIGMSPYSLNDSYDIKNIKSVIVDVSAANVYVVPVSGDNINIYVTGESTYEPDYQTEIKGGKELHVKINKSLKIGLSYSDLDVTVEVPKKYSDDFAVKTSSGKVDFDVTGLGDVSIASSSGSIKIGEVKCDDFEISASSGSIKAESIKCDELTVKSSSGSITIDELEADDSDISCSSGGVKIGDVKKTDLAVESSSGSIDVKYKNYKDNDIDLKCSSGGITLSLPSSAQFNIDAKASSGNISSDFDLEATTAKSNSLVGKTNSKATGKINLSASSGNINIVKK